MSWNLGRTSVRSALLAGGLLLSSAPAVAAEVTFPGSCRRAVRVVEWTTKSGPLARFVTDTLFSDVGHDAVWIGLGRTKDAFWTVESALESDACENCFVIDLVETRFDGARVRQPLLNGKIRAKLGNDSGAQREHVLRALWKLAKGPLPVKELQQGYDLTPATAPAASAPYFVVEVVRPGAFRLRWDLEVEPSMCWCFFAWTAKPAK